MLVKAKIKTYPDGTNQVIVYKESFLTGKAAKKDNFYVSRLSRTPQEVEDERAQDLHSNLGKSKRKIRDYILSNEFDMFWTITFAKDRKDSEKCFIKLQNWIKYMKKKYGKFDYLIIPEKHKTGEIHFHGVTNGFKGRLIDSGIKKKGITVYNADNWKHGFSTVTYIRDRRRTASYVTKYITKEMHQSTVGKGKKKYWQSNGLRLPVEQYLEFDPTSDSHTPSFVSESVAIFNNVF